MKKIYGFPPNAVNGIDGRVSCPAFEKVIDDGMCWECFMAGRGGPTDTAEDLRRWVAQTNRFASLSEFDQVCASCPHRAVDGYYTARG